jgi:hypothetical protein
MMCTTGLLINMVEGENKQSDYDEYRKTLSVNIEDTVTRIRDYERLIIRDLTVGVNVIDGYEKLMMHWLDL